MAHVRVRVSAVSVAPAPGPGPVRVRGTKRTSVAHVRVSECEWAMGDM